MNETVCFRCDWQGRARGSTCPSCGAPLYRPGRAPRGTDVVEDDEAHLGETPTRRSGPPGTAIAIAVVLALVTVISVDVLAGEPSPAGSEPVRGESAGAGTLVYLARDRGRERLWVVDWSAGAPRAPVLRCRRARLS